MVKRLRRRPLTAKTGVRFPMGLPKKKDGFIPFFFFGLPLPGREWRTRAARTAFGRAQRRSAEGAPARGFGGFPMGGTRSAFFGQFPFFFFGLPLPGREWRTRAARTAFGRAQRRSAEGARKKDRKMSIYQTLNRKGNIT